MSYVLGICERKEFAYVFAIGGLVTLGAGILMHGEGGDDLYHLGTVVFFTALLRIMHVTAAEQYRTVYRHGRDIGRRRSRAPALTFPLHQDRAARNR